jgi:serine protease Do
MTINPFKFTPPLIAALSAGLFGLPFFAEQGVALAQPAETKPAPAPTEPAPASPTVQQQLDLAMGFSAAFEKVAADVSPSVVNITATSTIQQRDFWSGRMMRGNQVATGSGFIISADGYILTNNHVISNAKELEVRLSDESRYKARVIGTDPATEVALIKIDAKGLTPAKLGDSNVARPGQWVLAIGSPYNLSQTVTAGIISAVGRSMHSEKQDPLTAYDNFLQTDASVNPGNSGGPLVNLRGEVLGINTAILSRSGGSVGLGLAVPINMARTVADIIKNTGSVNSGSYLGVNFAPEDQWEQIHDQSGNGPAVLGVPVAEVIGGSPAEKAGIKAGDVIMAVDGLATRDQLSLRTVVQRIAPGHAVPIQINRDGKGVMLDVTLAPMPKEVSDANKPSEASTGTNNPLGISVREVAPSTLRAMNLRAGVKGVQIVEVAQDSPIAGMNIEPGAIILSINGKATPDIESFSMAAGAAKPGRTVNIRVYSPTGGDMTISIRNGR